MNPKSVVCNVKIGKGLIMMHEYENAIKFYESMTNTDLNNLQLFYDYAILLNKLGNYQHCIDVIDKALSLMKENSDQFQTLCNMFKILQCRVFEVLYDQNEVILQYSKTYEEFHRFD
jgi:tetratricopeptide (TPR) repeat protein